MQSEQTNPLKRTAIARQMLVWLMLGCCAPAVHSAEAVPTSDRVLRSQPSQPVASTTRARISLPAPPDTPIETLDSKGLRGKASFYGPKFQGRKTATGELFNNRLFTAASNLLPLGSLVVVKRPDTNLCVVVKINDRMHPKHRTRIIDVSRNAAQYLDMVRDGVVKVQVMPLPANASASSPIDCAMGFEVEEICDDCIEPPLRFNEPP